MVAVSVAHKEKNWTKVLVHVRRLCQLEISRWLLLLPMRNPSWFLCLSFVFLVKVDVALLVVSTPKIMKNGLRLN